MDTTQTRESLITKITEQLTHATGLSFLNRYVIEALLKSEKTSVTVLQDLSAKLDACIARQEQNYQTYKEEMTQVVKAYQKAPPKQPLNQAV